MHYKPVTSEKAVRMIDLDNTLVFEVPRTENKTAVKQTVESVFTVKVAAVRTHIRNNVKLAYVKLNKSSKAADLAVKLGII